MKEKLIEIIESRMESYPYLSKIRIDSKISNVMVQEIPSMIVYMDWSPEQIFLKDFIEEDESFSFDEFRDIMTQIETQLNREIRLKKLLK